MVPNVVPDELVYSESVNDPAFELLVGALLADQFAPVLKLVPVEKVLIAAVAGVPASHVTKDDPRMTATVPQYRPPETMQRLMAHHAE